jgi:hypothetical protein
MKLFARLFSGLLLILYVVFAYQNQLRLPMLDTQGGYLSLDLYFTGTQLSQPISIAYLLGIAFALGAICNPLIVYVFTKSDSNDDYFHDEY